MVQVKPCIYLKMNNILGWKPEPVKCGDPDTIAEDGLPYDDCPFTLRKVFAIDHFISWHLMTNLTQHLASVAAKEAGDQNIWIDCSGRFLIAATHRPHICHGLTDGVRGEKIYHVEKFQIPVQDRCGEV